MTKQKIAPLVLICAVLIGVSAAISRIGTTKDTNTTSPYAYTQLGIDCASAAEGYAERATASQKQATDLSLEFDNQITITRQQITSTMNSGISDINIAKGQFWDVYMEGGMTSAEYYAKMAQLDQLAETTYVTPSDESQTKLNEIERNSQKIIDNIRADAVISDDNASRLRTCALAADNKQAFTVSDQAEFQRLIDKLNEAVKS